MAATTAAAAAATLLRLPLTHLSSRLLFSSSPLPPPRLHHHNNLSTPHHRLFSSLSMAAVASPPEAEERLETVGEEKEAKEEEEEEEEEVLVLPRPKLSVKERKELASYAHSLGKKLKSQQVGKGGVTPSVAAAFVENLESNELLKLKIHGNCPGELTDVILQLEESTGSIAVDQIGRSVILYRPSISKLKKREEEGARNSKNTRSVRSAATFRSQQKRRPASKGSSYKRD